MPFGAPVAFVVLAAGLGSRLSAVISDRPKWMVPVSDSLTVAEHQLASLETAVHADTPHIVVSGAHSQAIDKLAASWAEFGNTPFLPHYNPNFAQWNNWYSVLTGLEQLEALGWAGNIMVMNGDMFCPTAWLESFAADLVSFDALITMAIDPHHVLTDEAMKVSVSGDQIERIGKVDVPNAFGEYIGLFGLTPEGSRILIGHLRQIREDGRFNEWYEGGIQSAINAGVTVKAWQTPVDDWVEIDNEDDLAKARSIVAGAA